MDRISLLKSVSIFNGLSDEILNQFSANAKEINLKTGSDIFKEGNASDSFYVIETGEVVIFKKLGPGKEKTLAILGEGNIFGEMAFFSELPRTADAKTKSDCALIKIDRKTFLDITNEHSKEGLKILSGLLEVVMIRLEQTSRELATVYQASRVISSGKNTISIVKGLNDEVLLAIPEAKAAVTYLHNEYNQEFEQIAEEKVYKEIPENHPLFKKLTENQSVITSNDELNTILEQIDFIKGAKSFLIAPCIKSAKLLGFMALTNNSKKDAFKNNHSLLLSSVANQLAEAIENIKYQQEERDRKRLMNARESFNG
jgi:CRP-like cAMP-binding protein